jgi:hypothetical protein
MTSRLSSWPVPAGSRPPQPERGRRPPIQRTYDEAAQVMKAVADAGVDLDDVFEVLEDEGIQKFADSWDELTQSVRSELEDKK